MAGNAVGIGNLLRFPAEAAKFGGGAFIIPYLCALLLLGVPLMWAEWGIGRMGGAQGHGTTPGMFRLLWPRRAAGYVGSLGLVVPFCILVFYAVVASWCLGYSLHAFGQTFGAFETSGDMLGFFKDYTGGSRQWIAYGLFAFTIALNLVVSARGVRRGIETFVKLLMPMLFLLAIVLVVRVLTLDFAGAKLPYKAIDGLGFLWNPEFSQLKSPEIWIRAAGQVFFTLSLGSGCIHCYASYLRRNDDVTLSGLSTASINEFAEVIVGGTIAIPLAFAFFGLGQMQAIAQEADFDFALGFLSMPVAFNHLPVGALLCGLWFLLLFFAAATSTIALAQPVIAFLKDEVGLRSGTASVGTWLAVFVCGHMVIFGKSVIAELNFWAATMGMVVFCFAESIIWGWIYGAKNGLQELNRGAMLKLPRFMTFVYRFVTPTYILVILVAWLVIDAPGQFWLKDMPADEQAWRWGARAFIVVVLIVACVLTRRFLKMRPVREEPSS